MAGYGTTVYGVAPYGVDGDQTPTLQLAGQVGGVTASFTVTVLERLDLAGQVPAVAGAFTVNVLARMDLAGTIAPPTGTFTLAYEDQIVSLSGTVPQPTGSFTVNIIERLELAGAVPGVTGSFSLVPEGEVMSLAGTLGRVRGSFTISTGARGTVTTNRANGIRVSGSLPLSFTPDVDPAPAHKAAKRVIAATAFGPVDVTGTTATYPTDTARKRQLRERYVIGGKDATYINGAPTELTWQLVSPLLYGPATAKFPGIKTPFRQVGKGNLRWLRKGATVRVDLVNDNDNVIERGVYRGLVQAWNLDGNDLTVQIGGEASGRAAMRRRPLPVYSQHVRVGRIAYSLIRQLGLSFKPYLGPDTPATVIPRLGGMWYIEAIEHLCSISQRRDGTQYSIMPDSEGHYRLAPKDRTTVHATVYVDGSRVRANVRSDMVEEPNRVFANAVTPEGRRLTGVVSPGIIQGETPVWGGGVLSVGDTGPQVVLLANKLYWAGYLDLDEPGGNGTFDDDIAEAVEDLQEVAGLPVTGTVDEATWDALWDLGVTGYSLRWSHREPAAEERNVKKWRVTPSGSIIGRNPNRDPSVVPVDDELDLGSFITARQRRRIARARLHEADTDNWVGTIEVPMGAVIAGKHNPGDPLSAGDLMDLRLVKPGMNVWCPGFQSTDGTLFHVTGVDVASQTLQVDTRARDTLAVADVIRRNRDERMWRRGRRASIESKDVVGEWDGAAGGVLYNDVAVTSGHWCVFEVPAGDEGTISRIELKTNPNAEFVVAIFGGNPNRTSLASALDRRMGDPLTAAGYDNWDDPANDDWLERRGILYMAGGPDDPAGYHPRRKSRNGTLTGELKDRAGAAYRCDPFPILTVAVWADRDTVVPASRIMWNQLEPGA